MCYARTRYIGEINASLDGINLTIGGWVENIRDKGNIKFLLLRDKTGTIQLTVKKDLVPNQIFNLVESITPESVILVQGTLKASNMAKGGVEVFPDRIDILSIAETPLPLDASGKVPASLETRLNSRSVDLRKGSVTSVFKIQAEILKSFRGFFIEKGFLEIQTPILIGAASEGGTQVFKVQYFDRIAYLAQSPQLYKQMCIAGGLDKIFMVLQFSEQKKAIH